MNKQLIIIGASGHGKVCLDIAIQMKKWETIYFLDDMSEESEVLGCKILGTTRKVEELKDNSDFFVAIGDNRTRAKIMNNLIQMGCSIATLIHPKAIISSFVSIGEGTVIMPGAIINADTELGIGNIINTNASVDHDCIVGNYNHLSPSGVLLGNVCIGNLNWIGSNSVIKESTIIEMENIIGAQSFVNRNVGNNKTIFGVPGKVI